MIELFTCSPQNYQWTNILLYQDLLQIGALIYLKINLEDNYGGSNAVVLTFRFGGSFTF